tara:strand:- start:253 stop:510 length:258 start_codon:yes stop_codon:yes gene_type:complete
MSHINSAEKSNETKMLVEIGEYLLKKNKTEWAEFIAILILTCQADESSDDDDSDSDYEYSEDEGDAVKEEDYKVITDSDGHVKLF